jgi:hypothetical protein
VLGDVQDGRVSLHPLGTIAQRVLDADSLSLPIDHRPPIQNLHMLHLVGGFDAQDLEGLEQLALDKFRERE